MKKLLILLIVFFLMVAITNKSYSQILNGSFETWEDHTPTSWVTSNTAILNNVTFSPDSQEGSLSVSMGIKDFNGLPLAATLTTENTNSFTGHPVSEKYGTLKGYFKSELFGKARFRISVLAWHSSGDAIGASDTLIVNQSPENWELIELPIEYFDERIPSSIFISISIFDSTGSEPASINSWVLIDNLILDDVATGIENEGNTPQSFSLSQNYPNPFNPTTVIKYQIRKFKKQIKPNIKNSKVSLIVYDLLGKEVATLVNKRQTAGSYKVNFNGSQLTSGVYLFRLNVGEYVQTRKMTLMK